MKKLLILIICFQISLMPLLCINEFSFAESGGGGAGGAAWIAVTDKASMVAAFKAYCQSRNYKQTYQWGNGVDPISEAIVKFNYSQMENICDKLGIDIDTINAGLWYKIDQNNILKFWLTTSAMNDFNAMYSAIITEHNIQENDDKLIYSGEYYDDNHGDGAFVYICNSSNKQNFNVSGQTEILKFGTAYKYYGDILWDGEASSLTNNQYITKTFEIKNNTYTGYFVKVIFPSFRFLNFNNSTSNDSGKEVYYTGNNIVFKRGVVCIIKNKNTDKYYLGSFCNYTNNGVEKYNYYGIIEVEAVSGDVNINAQQGEFNTDPENKSMEVQTDSDTINNYITNNNSNVTNNYYDDDNPPQPPNYTNPFDNNPTGGTIGGDGSINFQMPDLNIDWNLGLNVENLPFPFSIPFDFNNALKMLDVEPETPRFQGTIHVPYINYDWEIDLDFGKYDEYETLINMFQKVFLFGYVISLILATRAVMHIY